MKFVIRLFAFIFIVGSLQSCALLSAAGISSQGQPIKEIKQPLNTISETSTVQVDHSAWDALLKKYVDEAGMVDYKSFQNDRPALQAYLAYLAEQVPTDFWSVQELLAYYINVYNAYTVDLILENYPVASIKDINGPWTKGIVKVGNKQLSLGGIENGILRKMNEPRIHFAINCASFSCPKLLNEAYTAANIDAQLDQVTRDFIEGDKNEISAQTPQLSSIFDWYKKDFVVDEKVDVIAYINQYSTVKINANAPIEYLEYNWSLNQQ